MAASSPSSRRANCSRWTRSVVRMNSTRRLFWTRARPSAVARWLLPAPGGPKSGADLGMAPPYLFQKRNGADARGRLQDRDDLAIPNIGQAGQAVVGHAAPSSGMVGADHSSIR